MAEKLLLKSDVEICGTGDRMLPPPLEPPRSGMLLHAAATRAALAATATKATFLVTCCKETTRFFRPDEAAKFIGAGLRVPQRLLSGLNSRSLIMNAVVNIGR